MEVAAFIHNALTIPMIIVSLFVVYLWFSPSKDVIKRGGKLTSEAWFIVGVFSGFLGESLDNIYWMIAWTMSYMHSSAADSMIEHGILSNIPFRLILGIFAGYCHVRSALSYRNSEEQRTSYNMMLAVAIALGLIYSTFLVFLR